MNGSADKPIPEGYKKLGTYTLSFAELFENSPDWSPSGPLGAVQSFGDIGLRAQFAGDQSGYQSPNVISDFGTAATAFDLLGSLHQGGDAVAELIKAFNEGKTQDFHDQRTIFVHIANVAKSSGEIVKHSASFAGASNIAGPAAYATGGFSALRHARKVAKAAHRIHKLRHVRQDDERLLEDFELDEEPKLVKLSKTANRASKAKVDLEDLSPEQRTQVLDEELLAYALRKNIYGVARKSMNTTAAALGIAGAATGMTPAGWALLGASSAIGLTVGTWKLGGWLKNRYRAAWKLAKGGKGFKIVEDDWSELAPNAEHFEILDRNERRGFSRAMYAVGTTLNPFVSKEKIQEELKSDAGQRAKLDRGQVSTKLGGGALEILERPFFSHYLAGRVTAEDGFADEMVRALFQESVRGGRRSSGSRRTGFKVMAKKLFISQAPEEYYALKEFLPFRVCCERLEYIEANMDGWQQFIDRCDEIIRHVESAAGGTDYENFLRWKKLKALQEDKASAIREKGKWEELKDQFFADWRATMTDLEEQATSGAWEVWVERWKAIADDRDKYECKLRDDLAKRIMDKLAS